MKRWGRVPPPEGARPEKSHPFGSPTIHPADWTLDLSMRAEIARLCEAITGHECPVLFHRTHGGFG